MAKLFKLAALTVGVWIAWQAVAARAAVHPTGRIYVADFGQWSSIGKGGAIGALHAIGDDGWRTLPLVKDGKVDPAWVQVGYGGFAVHDGTMRTDCDEKGLGLLLYRKEKFGDCQI